MLEYELLFPKKYSAACINGKFQRENTNREVYRQTAENKGIMIKQMNESDANLNGEAFMDFFTYPRIDYYLHKIIKLCKEKQIPLFIVQLPMNEPSWNKIKETGYYANFHNYLSGLAQETGIPIETEIPCYAPEFFGDYSHLNPRGAERFTAEIKAKYGL